MDFMIRAVSKHYIGGSQEELFSVPVYVVVEEEAADRYLSGYHLVKKCFVDVQDAVAYIEENYPSYVENQDYGEKARWETGKKSVSIELVRLQLKGEVST